MLVDAILNHDSCLTHAFFAARKQGMPVGQGLSFIQKAVGAGLGKPVELRDIVFGELKTVFDDFETVFVIAALSAF